MTNFFNNTFDNKKILITGHTGFKGSWLTAWLKLLNANILGLSLDFISSPSHFVEAKIDNNIIGNFWQNSYMKFIQLDFATVNFYKFFDCI